MDRIQGSAITSHIISVKLPKTMGWRVICMLQIVSTKCGNVLKTKHSA